MGTRVTNNGDKDKKKKKPSIAKGIIDAVTDNMPKIRIKKKKKKEK